MERLREGLSTSEALAKLAIVDMEGRKATATEMKTCIHVPAVPGAQGPSNRGVKGGLAWLLCNSRADTLRWIACGSKPKVSGQDHGISRPSGMQK